LNDYWRHHFTIIDSRLLSYFLKPLTYMPFSSDRTKTWPYWRLVFDGTDSSFFGAATHEVTRRYESRNGSQKVLNLSDEHQAAGWRALSKFGLPQGAWWVALHVRERATKRGTKGDSDVNYRNSDIRGHFKAIEHIVSQGGWVIRVGDPSMTPLPPMDHVVDYVHTDTFADWMDLFLNANCLFQLGTSSGANLLPSIFGRPLAGVNWAPIGSLPIPNSALMIHILKLYRSARDGHLLTFREVVETGVSQIWSDAGFAAAGVELIDNSPDEILDITKEMFEIVNGTARYDAEDERLQAEFHALRMSRETVYAPTLSRVGRDFLRRHRGLVLPAGPSQK
jgi:putative glycosyltransferase (TIGR04372 family)